MGLFMKLQWFSSIIKLQREGFNFIVKPTCNYQIVIMSSDIKRSSKILTRPMSAKVGSEQRQKSVSAKTHKHEVSEQSRLQTKIDSVLLYRSNRTTSHGLGLQFGEQKLIQKMRPQKVTKSKQTLYEQNLYLKRMMNDMDNEMRGIKTKMEKNRRRSLKYTAKLDMQFEKDIYWMGASTGKHVVMGVKNQYDKIQEENTKLKKQLDAAKRAPKYMEVQEKIIELEACYQENRRLREEIDKLIQIYKIPENLYEANKNNSAAKDLMIQDLRKEVDKYESDIVAYEEGLESMDKIIKQRDTKIQFLQKRIIQQENNLFSTQATNKKLQQQKQILKAKNQEVKNYQQQIQARHLQKVEQIKSNEQKRFNKQMVVFHNELTEKQTYIEKLQKQVGYLSALLKQVKPLEQSQAQDLEYSQSMARTKQPLSFNKKASDIHQIQQKKSGQGQHGPHYQQDQLFQSTSMVIDQKNLSQISQQASTQNKNRHYTLKRNKVKPQDIKDIGLEIKYRLLNKSIDINDAKIKIVGNEEGMISIGELVNIFAQAPFSLENEEKRIILARYLIEDPTEPVVYQDLSRTGEVTIVKSILHQIVPKYIIWSQAQRQQIKVKVCDMLTKFHKTLTQTVTQANKQQLVSVAKFIDLLNQQELNMGQQYNDFMIMEMLEGSTDLNNLSFKKLLSLVLV